jgi:RecB family exonuclease
MQRGLFLHGVLQRVWEELRDQETLHAALVNQTLDVQLERIASEVGRKELQAFGDTLQRLEIERGISVVRTWLALEEQRPPFKVVEVEQKRQLSLNGLTLDVRLDRLDLVGDEHVIIDYKSGASLPKVLADWRTPRPLNLQVPAYATMLGLNSDVEQRAPEKISGLVLVQLHSKETVVTGLVQHGGLGLAGPKTLEEAKYQDENWQALLARLKAAIETLAAEFTSGHALNESWHKADLEHCDVLPLLRLYENEASDD